MGFIKQPTLIWDDDMGGFAHGTPCCGCMDQTVHPPHMMNEDATNHSQPGRGFRNSALSEDLRAPKWLTIGMVYYCGSEGHEMTWSWPDDLESVGLRKSFLMGFSGGLDYLKVVKEEAHMLFNDGKWSDPGIELEIVVWESWGRQQMHTHIYIYSL